MAKSQTEILEGIVEEQKEKRVEFPKDYDKSDPLHENGVDRGPNRDRWQPGQSGNPKGGPEGKGKRQDFRNLLDAHGSEIIMAVVEKAKDGDMQAMNICMKRLLPELKSEEIQVAVAEDSAPLVIATS